MVKWFYNHRIFSFQDKQKLSSRRPNIMLPKRLFLGALLLTALVIITGCATTGDYKDDPSSQYRIASDECIGFGHVTGSDDYQRCMEKRLGSGKEIASANGDTKQTSIKIPPPSSDDYELECRTRSVTGTRFKQRTCAPKAEWAEFDRKNRKETDQLIRDVEHDNPYESPSSDPMGGQSGGMPRNN